MCIRDRLHLLVDQVQFVQIADHQIAEVFHLLVISLQNLIEAGEIGQRTGVNAGLDAVVGVTVVDGPVSYTHLDVYKRQGIDKRRHERAGHD